MATQRHTTWLLMLHVLLSVLLHCSAQGDNEFTGSGFGSPTTDDDYWTMIDDEDLAEDIEMRDFSVTTRPSKNCMAWITSEEDRDTVMQSLRRDIEEFVGSLCACNFTIGNERLLCIGDELVYNGNITERPQAYNKEELVRLISLWAWDEPKVTANLDSSETMLIQVVRPLEDPKVLGVSSQAIVSSVPLAILILITSLLTYFSLLL